MRGSRAGCSGLRVQWLFVGLSVRLSFATPVRKWFEVQLRPLPEASTARVDREVLFENGR
jgi:hypothetical protein